MKTIYMNSSSNFQNTPKLDTVDTATAPRSCSHSSPGWSELGNGVTQGVLNTMLITAVAGVKVTASLGLEQPTSWN